VRKDRGQDRGQDKKRKGGKDKKGDKNRNRRKSEERDDEAKDYYLNRHNHNHNLNLNHHANESSSPSISSPGNVNVYPNPSDVLLASDGRAFVSLIICGKDGTLLHRKLLQLECTPEEVEGEDEVEVEVEEEERVEEEEEEEIGDEEEEIREEEEEDDDGIQDDEEEERKNKKNQKYIKEKGENKTQRHSFKNTSSPTYPLTQVQVPPHPPLPVPQDHRPSVRRSIRGRVLHRRLGSAARVQREKEGRGVKGRRTVSWGNGTKSDEATDGRGGGWRRSKRRERNRKGQAKWAAK